jgi:hypothetical protein
MIDARRFASDCRGTILAEALRDRRWSDWPNPLPSLHGHYPVSPLLRSSPHGRSDRSAPAGSLMAGSRRDSIKGLIFKGGAMCGS